MVNNIVWILFCKYGCWPRDSLRNSRDSAKGLRLRWNSRRELRKTFSPWTKLKKTRCELSFVNDGNGDNEQTRMSHWKTIPEVVSAKYTRTWGGNWWMTLDSALQHPSYSAAHAGCLRSRFRVALWSYWVWPSRRWNYCCWFEWHFEASVQRSAVPDRLGQNLV